VRKLFDYPGPLWKLASGAGFALIVVSVVVWTLLIFFAVFLFRVSRQTQTTLVRQWLSVVCLSHRIRFQVEGVEHHDPRRPALVVSNHQSLYDIPAVFAALAGDIRMLAKKELFQIPLFGHSLAMVEMIPVQRESQKSSRAARDKVLERIRSGLQVWLAPEGTRSKDGALGPFKRGSFALAIEAGVPVQPIVVLDSRLAAGKGSLMSRPGSLIHVRILPPISTEGMTLDDRARLSELVREKIDEALRGGGSASSGVRASPLRPASGR
jgi:1-acyl-sn-glycerol-3-phosphate acyltransferase